MKAFIFVLQLLLPDGTEQSRAYEPMPDLVSCLSRVAEVHSRAEMVNEAFQLRVGCVQLSEKAQPA